MNIKAACFACVLLLCAFAGFSQGGGPRRTVEERVKMTMDTLKVNLKLDAAQVTGADSIFTGFYKEMDVMREGGTRPDRSVMEAKMSERDEKLKKVFTAEQFSQYKVWETARMERMRAQRPGN